MTKKCEYCKKKFIPRSAKVKNLTLKFMVSQCDCKEIEQKKEQIGLLYKESLIDEYFLINDFSSKLLYMGIPGTGKQDRQRHSGKF